MVYLFYFFYILCNVILCYVATAAATAAAGTGGRLLTDEDREVGEVNQQVYADYLTSAGGRKMGIFLFVLNYSVEIISVLASWWLSYWSEVFLFLFIFYLFSFILYVVCCDVFIYLYNNTIIAYLTIINYYHIYIYYCNVLFYINDNNNV